MDVEEEKRKRPAVSEFSAREDSLSSCTEEGLSLSKVKRKRRRSKEADNGDGEDGNLMSFIRKEKESLEAYVFNEANKINKSAIKVILSKWSVLENKMQDLIMENNQLKTQLECHQTYLPVQKSYAQAAGTSVGQSFGPTPSVRAGTPWKPETRKNREDYEVFSLSIEDFLRDLEGLLNDIDCSRVVICMDANAKSIAWFSDETNQKGSLLEEFIIAQGLSILNKPSKFPTYISSIAESNIDVTLASPYLCNLIQRWSVSDKVVASDHNLISFRIVHKDVAVNLKMVKESYNIKAADWDKFAGLLSTELDENCLTRMLELSADDYLKKLYRILTD
ncbi:hypothetical protein KPH14_001266, partial [Odynerus spinipes]